jgi:ribosomal protein L11 methylase PrmA
MSEFRRDPGSFRDPSGSVYQSGGRIFRTVAPNATSQYEAARDAGIYAELVRRRRLVSLQELNVLDTPEVASAAAYVLEHEKLPFISYPYEWSFSLLKDAAIFHLDFHLDLLSKGFTLSDASAYNVQFVGPKPIFIDHLSIRKYRKGELWTGHRQFCEEFLNPLLLRSIFGIPHNYWYRGRIDGIPVSEIASLLPFRKKMSWRVLTHVVLQDYFQRRSERHQSDFIDIKKANLPLIRYEGLLKHVRHWVADLEPGEKRRTLWSDYETCNTYNLEERLRKREVVAQFIKSRGCKTIVDLGCNTGDYSLIALEAGAERVLGFDFDQQALDRAHSRAKSADVMFLPLFLDAMNPSPDQGWQQAERLGFSRRVTADGVFALAFEHHLSIAHNVPMDHVLDWICLIAPRGVIEYVPKTDPTVQKLLSHRTDIFPDYTEENFRNLLGRRRRITRSERISNSGRVLFVFDT